MWEHQLKNKKDKRKVRDKKREEEEDVESGDDD
jgi:hypothetical protein